MKIGIIGYGVVGKAVDNTLSKKYETVKYDKYLNLSSFEELVNCKFVFICVPTPFSIERNELDCAAVRSSLSKLADLSYPGTVIIKSTLPPGSCDLFSYDFNIKIVFNPEFLRESVSPNEDFANQHTVVIGTHDELIYNRVKDLFKEVLNPLTKYYFTSLIEAEMIKLSQNVTLSSRVTIANLIFDACLESGLDYNRIREIAFDRFDILGPNMVEVPGPDGKRGFGGKCLPKDISAFNSVYFSKVLDEIIKYNLTLRDDILK